jgi:hypothetical protein
MLVELLRSQLGRVVGKGVRIDNYLLHNPLLPAPCDVNYDLRCVRTLVCLRSPEAWT